jgi:Na+-transporting NADH:ubiquinone oxidoreductase subunit NqrC
MVPMLVVVVSIVVAVVVVAVVPLALVHDRRKASRAELQSEMLFVSSVTAPVRADTLRDEESKQ